MTPDSVPVLTGRRDLRSLREALVRAGLLAHADHASDRDFDCLAFDSREIGPKGLFVAIRGAAADGHQFIDKAVQNGATALVCEAASAGHLPAGVARMRVTDSRRALAVLAAEWYGHPAQGLSMIGVTGTNGKTTTAWLTAQGLERANRPAGFIGTIGVGFPGSIEASSFTTPDALSLQGRLHDFVAEEARACVMEVSSHALDQDRVYGIPFRVAIFTNLTRDHLDYHPDFETYLEAKRRLFLSLETSATAVLNADDPSSTRMGAGCAASIVTYGTRADADIQYEVLSDGVEGLTLRLDGQVKTFRLSGRFNAANLAASYAALRALSLDGSTAVDSLASARPAPGRFEVIRRASDRAAIVDYAHTPDALQNVLAAARELVRPGGRLWCVFGCGGDRDRGKRPLMGAIAESLSDRIIVTSDNPRTEDPEGILFDIRQGLGRPQDAFFMVDRREAIRSAMAGAMPGDVVVVAGKGHEPYQVVGTERLPFDDREEVLNALVSL